MHMLGAVDRLIVCSGVQPNSHWNRAPASNAETCGIKGTQLALKNGGLGFAGVFKAWALVGARLYSVPLRVPRKFYVNSVLPPEDPESPAQTLGGLKVSRTLPFGREAFHIYEASNLQAMALEYAAHRHIRVLQRGSSQQFISGGRCLSSFVFFLSRL